MKLKNKIGDPCIKRDLGEKKKKSNFYKET
jgi:hypothetical protein